MNTSLTLRKKLLSVVIPLIIIPLSLSVAIAYQMALKNHQKQSELFINSILHQVSGNLDRYVRELNTLSTMPLTTEGVLNILRRHQDRDDVKPITIEEQFALGGFHSLLMWDRKEIKGYFLYCRDGTLLGNTEFDVEKTWSAADETWMAEAREANGKLVFIPRGNPTYYLFAREDVLSVARMIIDPITFRELGFVKIDLFYQGIRNILYPTHQNMIRFYTYSHNNELLFPASLEDEAFIPKGNLVEIEGVDYLAAGSTSATTGIEMYLLYPYDVLQKDAHEIQRALIIITVAFLVLTIIVCVWFSDKLTRPLRILYSDMKEFGKGDFTRRTLVMNHDEIGTLSKGFNRMAERIQSLVRENYQIELNRRIAEVLLLQSQMNPHLLYNTLETISMSALNHDDIETSDIVAQLGKILRYSISIKKELVRLGSEIRFCEDYLDLQILRLGNRIKYEVSLDVELEDCLIPKLILQPFVENVIMHALGSAPVKIWILAIVQWDKLLLIIKDNGVGMSPEHLQEIEEKMNSPEENTTKVYDGTSHGGIALRNVHKRIQLLYGPDNGVSVVSSPSKGTVFLICMPLMWREEENE
ncbi:sensor histidine kinase [Muricomes intestini]|uniref:sensor histidine kinase n=1 Tax=Muricomes intestini TaxID=1796634 RepID=UPI002FDF5227